MRDRRRRLAGFFAALLVALTAVSATHIAPIRTLRLLSAGGDSAPTISIAVPRTTAMVARETTRLPALSHDDVPGFLPALLAPLATVPLVAQHAHAAHSRVRRAQGLASTYDANAPPAHSS